MPPRKHHHEIRDPVHVFIRLDSDERRVLDSRPFQRLRSIHQLAMSYLVYPGATHRRFEHSLGVMELADRVYRVITAEENRDDRVREIFPHEDAIRYWRRVLRMAALCHDMGHLPFSHGAEELLPAGKRHEDISLQLIKSPELAEVWSAVRPPLDPDDIAKLAIGREKLADVNFTPWEAILSEIIVGDCFGVDRMDYLLRDSLHTGVAYGRFDHFRLIDTLRILPTSAASIDPVLGIESGGLESAEALMLARYFMYSQVYFHRVRRAYNLHLQEFMARWKGRLPFPVNADDFLCFTDDEVSAELRRAAGDQSHPGHDPARRIVHRDHHRVLYDRNPVDLAQNPEIATALFNAAKLRFPDDDIYLDVKRQPGSGNIFPVQVRDRQIVQSLEVSEVLNRVPVVAFDYVFMPRERLEDARTWLKTALPQLLQPGNSPEELP